jgi:hypothetical protein
MLVKNSVIVACAVYKECQDMWKAIVVDEFQDTSAMQYCLLKTLASHSRITIVGDEDQVHNCIHHSKVLGIWILDIFWCFQFFFFYAECFMFSLSSVSTVPMLLDLIHFVEIFQITKRYSWDMITLSWMPCCLLIYLIACS